MRLWGGTEAFVVSLNPGNGVLPDTTFPCGGCYSANRCQMDLLHACARQSVGSATGNID